MSRPDAETARVAVVGAPTPEGGHLRQALAEHGVPGSHVDLFGSTGGEARLSEYDGEARLIRDTTPEELAGHDVVFLCENGEATARLARDLDPDQLVIDLVNGLDGAVRRIHPGIDFDPGAPHGTRYAIPHPVALLLAEVLHPLERSFGLEEAFAIVLRPASDFGEDGVLELREQTVRLLNFQSVPTDVFGRQLAFNLIPGVSAADEVQSGAVAADVACVLGWDRPGLAVRQVTVPLFYGHGIQLRIRLREGGATETLGAALAAAGLAPSAEPRTPLEVTGEAGVDLAELREDGLGGYWLWLTAGEAATKGAEQAVRLASRLVSLT